MCRCSHEFDGIMQRKGRRFTEALNHTKMTMKTDIEPKKRCVGQTHGIMTHVLLVSHLI